MARWDHVDSAVGMHRVTRKNAATPADYGKIVPVGLDASGLMVEKSPGTSGFIGVVIPDRTTRRAGDRLDVGDKGEIVECEGLQAGRKYYIQNDGSVSTTRSAIYLGYTVEADRLVVQFDGKADAA